MIKAAPGHAPSKTKHNEQHNDNKYSTQAEIISEPICPDHINSLIVDGSLTQLTNEIDSLYNIVIANLNYEPLRSNVQNLKNTLQRFNR